MMNIASMIGKKVSVEWMAAVIVSFGVVSVSSLLADERSRHDIAQDRHQQPTNTPPQWMQSEASDRYAEELNELEILIIESIQGLRQELLEGLLGGTAGIDRVNQNPHTRFNASDIYLQYRHLHISRWAPEDADPSEVGNVAANIQKQLDASHERVLAQARNVIDIADPVKSGLVELCVIIPLLAVSDEQWTFDDVVQLPRWMRNHEAVIALETFALHVDRFRMAFVLSCYRTSQPGALASSREFVGYLSGAAARLQAQGHYHIALRSLRKGREVATDGELMEASTDLSFKIAELLSLIGHQQLAADEMKLVLKEEHEANVFGRGAMLRIKYLYEAKQYHQLVEEADNYFDSEKVRPYRPQILYINWLAARRMNEQDQASSLQTKFLELYPNHALGADMHFAAATQALVSSDYAEALRRLEIIEYRYPQYGHMSRVRDIQNRLRAMGN